MGWRGRGWLLAIPLVCLFAACGGDKSREQLGGQCELNSECDAPLVCRLDFCRVECATSRDCGAGLSCVLDAEGLGACQLPEERRCSLASDCPAPLVCVDRQCVNECAEVGSSRDCPLGAVCEEVDGGLGCIEQGMVHCAYDGDCPTDPVRMRCIEGLCREECRYDRDCRRGYGCAVATGGQHMCVLLDDGGILDGGVTDGAPDGGVDGSTGPWTVTLHLLAAGNGSAPTPVDADWVAFSDGDGPWTAVAGGGGLYSFEVTDPSARYGLAVGCAADFSVAMVQALASEATDVHLQASAGCRPPRGSGFRASGTIAGGECSLVAMAGVNLVQVCASAPGTYFLDNVPTGTHDLVAVTREAPFRAYVERDLSVSGALTQDIDYADATRAADSPPVAISMPAGWTLFLSLYTRTTQLNLAGPFIGTPAEYVSLPASLQRAGDIHSFCASGPVMGGPPESVWTECGVFAAPTAIAVDNSMPQPHPEVTGTTVDSLTWMPFPEALGFEAQIAGGGAPDRAVLTAAWLDGATTYTFPDLSTAPGWTASYARTEPYSWSLSATRSTGAAADMIQIHNGREDLSVAVEGTRSITTSLGGSTF